MWTIVLVLQGVAAVVLLRRLLPGMRRPDPVPSRPEGLSGTTVSVIVPTLNEAERVGPCLAGLARQGEPLAEVIVVDSGSQDGTQDLVRRMSAADPRFRLETDPPLPAGWVGKVWALEHGLSCARGEWILGMDADTEPNPGLVAGVVAAAREHGLDMVSFAPRFAGQSSAERLLQPALLVTLVYRTGAPAPRPPASRLLANGQCFLVRRDVLVRLGGYAPARASFADDVALARHLAGHGAACGFLDGRRLYRVRAYRSAGEMWREWGRSVDLSDVVSRPRQLAELAGLALVQAAPLLLLLAAASGAVAVPTSGVRLNAGLFALRLLVLAALAPSYERRGLPYWLSWTTDAAAVVRLALSTARRPRSWRGRRYDSVRP